MNIIVYGNGAMARVLYAYLVRSNDVVGFTVDDECIRSDDKLFCGLPLIPFSEVQNTMNPGRHNMIVAVGYKEMNTLRAEKCRQAEEKGYQLISYVHPSLIHHDDVEIGKNCIILDHVSIHPGSMVGDGVFISSNVNIGHDCRVGDMCWINSGVAVAGGCSIGARSFLGVNASIAGGVALGEANYIAANTLMNRSSDRDEVYISPAGERFRLKSRAFLRFTKQ